MTEPPVFSSPPGHINTPLPSLAGRRVALIHPWALGWQASRPAEFTLGVVLPAAHRRLPWSGRRWRWVMAGMARRCDAVWVGEADALAGILAGAESEGSLPAEPDYAQTLAALLTTCKPQQSALPDTGLPVTSFSAYFNALQKSAAPLFRASPHAPSALHKRRR